MSRLTMQANTHADTGVSSSSSTALNPAANTPVGEKAVKAASGKSGKKPAKADPISSLPSTSLQDRAVDLVQQVCMHNSNTRNNRYASRYQVPLGVSRPSSERLHALTVYIH